MGFCEFLAESDDCFFKLSEAFLTSLADYIGVNVEGEVNELRLVFELS